MRRGRETPAHFVWAKSFAYVCFRPIADISPGLHIARMQLQRPRDQRVILAILIVLALGWFAYVRTHQPRPASVNGIYRNSCCEPITLKDGVLITANFRVPFELRLMKYGLDTDMNRDVEVRSGKLALSAPTDSGGFLFSDDGRAFTLCDGTCGAGHEFQFRRR